MYRTALNLRANLLTTEDLEWEEGGDESVLHFSRPGGWQSITNFGPESVPLPDGAVAISSAELDDGRLPPDTTAWIVDPARR